MMKMLWEDNIDFRNTRTATSSDYIYGKDDYIFNEFLTLKTEIQKLLWRVVLLEEKFKDFERRTDE